MAEKYCEICGRGNSGELTAEERRNNLTQSDIELVHCRKCGACVCGFCDGLGVCCD